MELINNKLLNTKKKDGNTLDNSGLLNLKIY